MSSFTEAQWAYDNMSEPCRGGCDCEESPCRHDMDDPDPDYDYD